MSISLQQQLERRLTTAFKTLRLDVRFATLRLSDRPDLSDFQCNGALALAKQLKQNPRDLANKIVEELKGALAFERISMEAPGFINLRVSASALNQAANAATKDKRCGIPKVHKPKKIVLDFGGMNVAKPMHVGHLRSSVIGDCLQRIMRFQGQYVKSDVHLGDWGTQMGLILVQLQNEQPNLPYFNPKKKSGFPGTSPVTLDDLQRLYPKAAKRAKEDPDFRALALAATVDLQRGRPGYRALWKHFVSVSLASQKEDMKMLGIYFDWWKGESDVNARMKRLLRSLEQKKIAKRSDGALIIELEPSGSQTLPPLLLAKSDGAYLYATSDLATIEERIVRHHAQEVDYVVDQRQSLHFQQLFQAAAQLGWTKKTKLVYIGFGTMNGPDGKPFKTRAGGVMRLKELFDQILKKSEQRMNESHIGQTLSKEEQREVAARVALATLKFADLSNHRSTDYLFNLDQFTKFEGKTGPYLLYSAVRMRSLLAKAAAKGYRPKKINIASSEERALCLHLIQFPEIVQTVACEFTPHLLAEFLYQLSQRFNRFYEQCPILQEGNAQRRASRLGLVLACENHMVLGLKLLGIEVPKRM